MKVVYVVGGLVLLAALVWGGLAFTNHLTPYVSIAEARAASRTVQVHGYMRETLGYDDAGRWRFVLVDDRGDVLTVACEQVPPAGLEGAAGLVAIGRYDASANLFRATRLLSECPSKYQEQSEEYQRRRPTEVLP